MAVSVLDLEQYRSNQSNRRMQPLSDPMLPILGKHQTILMFFSLYDVNFVQLDGGALRKVLDDLTALS